MIADTWTGNLAKEGGDTLTWKERWKYWIFLFGMFLCLGGCQYSFLPDLYPEEGTYVKEVQTEESTSEYNISKKDIYIHVCGGVKHPGLYTLCEGDRIDAAIQAAGGFTKNADQESVNLAEFLVDGTQIVVKRKSDGEEKDSASKEEDKRVNLNKADKTELMTLPGIGESRAEAILSYRNSHGSFSAVEELTKVEGIGDGIYQRIKSAVMVE